ncbi:MAG: Smr/MutS family protein [Oscillospiraceae bacterium]|nr:Smr/MutS family protein [Oscillospiraceae bacterium]
MTKSKTIDVHGLTGDQAKARVEREIRLAPPKCESIIVIHGCNNGTVLRDTVRRRVRSKRILDIVPCFANDGQTTIYLKE